MLSILRIVAALVSITSGTMKLFGLPPLPPGTPDIALMSQAGSPGCWRPWEAPRRSQIAGGAGKTVGWPNDRQRRGLVGGTPAGVPAAPDDAPPAQSG